MRKEMDGETGSWKMAGAHGSHKKIYFLALLMLKLKFYFIRLEYVILTCLLASFVEFASYISFS